MTRDPSFWSFVGECFPVFLGPSWAAWRAALSALFGTAPEDEAAAELIRRCTGRGAWLGAIVREAWLVVGRRGGKSRLMALVAVYLAAVRQYRLSPGEQGRFMVLAADRRQARVVKGYIAGFLHAHPSLEALIVGETAEEIELTTGIIISIQTSNFRSVRGFTVVGAICDEIAFWYSDDSANPDTEILNALRPAMATVPGALLIAISSPYARRGELYKQFQAHYGKADDPILVWQADTRTMNATVPQAFIDAAYADDEALASAEYGAQFRSDLEKFVTIEALDAVTIPGRLFQAPRAGLSYVAFVDPSGGSADSMTAAITHRTPAGGAALDLLLAKKPPFNPDTVVSEFAHTLHTYGVRSVTGDAYGGEWPRERLRAHGVDYRVSDRTKSELYLAALPIIMAGRCELLEHARLRAELLALERRTTRNGRDIVDHPPGRHDDVANSACGALVLAAGEQRALVGMMRSRWIA